jgi:hypothetical protein
MSLHSEDKQYDCMFHPATTPHISLLLLIYLVHTYEDSGEHISEGSTVHLS